jgi:AcrR family transcriptional regulator
MATRTQRDDTLSRRRIVDAAVAMLDAEGESGLTFRALAAQLRTGPGAIYWHVANKSELLVAVTDAVLDGAVAGVTGDASPQDAIRALAIGVFDAIDAHPWVGPQLSRLPSQTTLMRIFELVGRQLQALGVPVADQFDAASALQSYIVGAAGQNAAVAREVAPGTNRSEFLGAVATGLDPEQFPFTKAVAGQLRDHDDRRQFLAGLDLILAGIAARPRPASGPRPRQPGQRG